MINYICVDAQGRIVMAGCIQSECLHSIDIPPGTTCLLGFNATPGMAYYDYSLCAVLPIPPAPGVEYTFDYDDKLWKFDKGKALRNLEGAVQILLDNTARLNGNWDSMLSARAAATLVGPFQAQALSLASWWSNVWSYCYTVLDEVEAGTRPPLTVDELLAELPLYIG